MEKTMTEDLKALNNVKGATSLGHELDSAC